MNLHWIQSAYPLKPKSDPWACWREQWREDDRKRRWRDMENSKPLRLPWPSREPMRSPGYIWRQVPLPEMIAVN